jgi:hypothetical protein
MDHYPRVIAFVQPLTHRPCGLRQIRPGGSCARGSLYIPRVLACVYLSPHAPTCPSLPCPAQDPATAPRARFFSEFGFQGLPSIESLARVSDPRGLSLYSDWFAFRQRYIYVLSRKPPLDSIRPFVCVGPQM